MDNWYLIYYHSMQFACTWHLYNSSIVSYIPSLARRLYTSWTFVTCIVVHNGDIGSACGSQWNLRWYNDVNVEGLVSLKYFIINNWNVGAGPVLIRCKSDSERSWSVVSSYRRILYGNKQISTHNTNTIHTTIYTFAFMHIQKEDSSLYRKLRSLQHHKCPMTFCTPFNGFQHHTEVSDAVSLHHQAHLHCASLLSHRVLLRVEGYGARCQCASRKSGEALQQGRVIWTGMYPPNQHTCTFRSTCTGTCLWWLE